MTGLTSISFRKFSIDQIITLAKQAGLRGIEWGSDVHVKPGDMAAAEYAAEKTREAGLSVTSYGSYLRAGEEEGDQSFELLLRSAGALCAPVIRVWAGTKAPKEADPWYRSKIAEHLKGLVDRAENAGIHVAVEYHRRTLTEDAESAAALLEAVPGLYTYWQPNPEITPEQNLKELCRVLPYLLNVHVFQWEGAGNIRHPLSDGEREWETYAAEVMKNRSREHHFLLEFVKDDDPAQCLRDAGVLRHILKEQEI